MIRIVFISILFCVLSCPLVSQAYYLNYGTGSLQSMEIANGGYGCETEYIGYINIWSLTMTPENELLQWDINNNARLLNVDLDNASLSLYYEFDSNLIPSGWGHFQCMVSVGGGIFYAGNRSLAGPSGRLWKLDINDGSVIEIGNTGYSIIGDLALFNGEIYYYTMGSGNNVGIVRVDLTDPGNSELVTLLPDNIWVGGLTASPYCNTLVGVEFTSYNIILINLIDGAITTVCSPGNNTQTINSMLEFDDLSGCDVSLDLDVDDSSGADEADYNSSEVTCLSQIAVVADEDVRMFYDDFIDVMTIQITGFVPDGISEIIDITGSVPNIDVSGQGTEVLTLSNAGGAKSTDFIDALHLVRYSNNALQPTGGQRTIEVQFTTASGAMSNVAIAFIQVNELSALDVDLGPDQMICEGESITLDAGSFLFPTYQWSSGETSQTISTMLTGEYSVTVSNNFKCPDADTVLVTILPTITVALTGDTEVCNNESATLTLNTNAPFPITVEIQPNPGLPLVFDDVVGTYSFTDTPQSTTTYTITDVTPSSPACIEIPDPEQVISVFPAYSPIFDVSICDGDSVWLGFYWETIAGMYEYGFNSMHGCDSIVTTNISILPAVMIQAQAQTCDLSATGVFITNINNPNGCDTVLTTTVTLLAVDTTFVNALSCNLSQIGASQDTLTGTDGCDSLIITTTGYIPPVDTTFLFLETCDSSLVNVINHVAIGVDGCDSIVVTTTTYRAGDTTYVNETSCDSSEVGVINHGYTGTDGCDSLVILTVTFALGDTTYLFATSCDLSDVGVTSSTITGVDGCDSTLITTITISEQDSVFLTGTTCDPMQAGVTTEALINQFGCDSIVTTTITLLPSDTTYLSDASCTAADTGVVTTHYMNQYGCDSMVITTVALLPSDQTFLNETTCLSSEAGMFITSHLNQYGCDSIVTLTVALISADTTELFFKTCDPAQIGVINHTTTGSDGCDSVIVEITELFPLPILEVQSAIDYNGFDISCTDEPDGSAIAIITGIAPFSYLWSTTETDQQITGLSAGDYAITITDGNGCTSNDVITLEQPEELRMGFEVSKPDCFDQALGTITVDALGGVPPYSYAIDGGLFQDSPVFNALGDGIYQLTVMDANGCTAADIISIDVPLMIHVDLGADQTISTGDTTLIEAIVNLPFDSISTINWNGLDTSACANCLTQVVAPLITTAYSVSVTSVDGCGDADTMNLSVITKQHLYIPNIFSPNGDGINDVLQIGADDGVREISAMEIYDRWGNFVFGFRHKTPDDPEAHWDGLFKGQALNPGVFTYKAVIEFKSGEQEVRYGDVTMVR